MSWPAWPASGQRCHPRRRLVANTSPIALCSLLLLLLISHRAHDAIRHPALHLSWPALPAHHEDTLLPSLPQSLLLAPLFSCGHVCMYLMWRGQRQLQRYPRRRQGHRQMRPWRRHLNWKRRQHFTCSDCVARCACASHKSKDLMPAGRQQVLPLLQAAGRCCCMSSGC